MNCASGAMLGMLTAEPIFMGVVVEVAVEMAVEIPP